ncbi:alpha/beta hydrolase [Geoalkalibacter halelectricus]|uniref:Alpha/beta hydrolase n=1 Tax=Geoalkalibacter halelectricus TaxID=2847045 RepID=A0ABY5ZHH7_9BACT|nr:alpha/beta hydrolase [Geoalkalibacter halelectricus]UWZ77909.1 alpha/beta hydrolase [Geoalkalibacter halelectricus]
MSLMAGCSPRRGYEAVLLLADVAAGEEPSRLKATRPQPKRVPVRIPAAPAFPLSAGFFGADLYLPGEPVRAGVLLVPGVAEEGKDDPRLVAFAYSLARSRFAVLVPELESMHRLEVRGENVDEVAAAFAWFRNRTDLVPSGRLGMMAFSYAVGPTVLAAKDAAVAEDVRFVAGVGGYYDIHAVMTFFTTGWFQDGERWRRGDPNRYGKWIFVEGNLDRLEHESDRELFQEMADRRKDDLDAPIADLAEGLSEEGLALYRFITNEDRERAPELIAALPEFLRRDIDALNLADKDLGSLRARLILIHGLDDPIIPYTESRALKKALPAGQVDLFLVRGLMHVDVTPGLVGSWRMWRSVTALLRERDGVR